MTARRPTSPLPKRRGSRRDRSRPGESRNGSDPAAQRVREAGGPRDSASYVCACGFVFVAPVSTNVACPHCGAGQAW
jgi:hypothetical protein